MSWKNRVTYVQELLPRIMQKIKADGIKNSYQAGFYNGLCVADHNLRALPGQPAMINASKFHLSEMATKAASRPAMTEMELEAEKYRDEIVAEAIALHEARIAVAWKEGDKVEETAAAKLAIGNLVLAVENYTTMIGKLEEACKKDETQQELPLGGSVSPSVSGGLVEESSPSSSGMP